MQRLRFALLCDETRLERWHLRCLDELEPVAQLIAIVGAAPPESPRPAHSRLLAGYARRVGTSWSASEDVRRLDEAPRSLGSEPVDFVLRLGAVAVPLELLEAARLGVWCFEHETEDSVLPFFDEVYSGADITRTALVAHRPRDSAGVLELGAFRTDKRSYVESRNRIQEAIAAWPARACRRSAAAGDVVCVRAGAAEPPVARTDAGAVLPLYAAKVAARRAGVAWSRLFRHPQWNVGVLRRPIATLLASGTYTDEEVEWFPLEGRSGFLADPFALVQDGRLQILCEFFDYRKSTGRICALEHSAAGFVADPVDPLSLPVHVSYPYLLDLPEGVYCIPETAAAGEVALYRKTESGSWGKVGVLLSDVAGVDPTVFRHEGRWWLMCTRQGPQEDTELWVWHAGALDGPWAPHALNPVKTDVRGARPGGAPFVHGGVLHRPAQDCSATYGGGIVVQRVTRLTPTEFAEDRVTVVGASASSRFPIGPHTLTPAGDVVLVDGRRTVFVPAALWAFLGILRRAIVRRVRRMA